MKTAKRAWLFFALCCIFLMGSSMLRTGVFELKMADLFSPLLGTSQGVKKQFFYLKMAIFSPDQLDRLFSENSELRLGKTLQGGSLREGAQVAPTSHQVFAASKVLLRPLEKWSSSMW